MGEGGVVLREKLELIKVVLSDCKGETEELSEMKIEELLGITSYIHSFSRFNTIISWQQS